jgi:hypothetical protein
MSSCGVKRLCRHFVSNYFLRVHLAHLRLRDFRNYARLDTDFAPGFHLLPGDNAQGKMNILETASNRYLPWPARLCYI